MEGYDRMRLDVVQMISVIEQHPEVWDRSSEKYKGAKRDAWPKIVTALFPEWPNLPTQQQTQILGDVKTRWRSVTDRYLKSLKTPSGSSLPRKRVPYGDQLQFILGSRSLRRTESNVSAQTPPDPNDGDTTVDSIGEEVEDCIMNSQESPGNMSLSGRSPEITDSLGEHDVAANTTTSSSSDAGANSGSGVSRHMGRGAASVRPVALKRTIQKKTKQGQIIEQLTTKTLNLLDNSSKQDEHDKFGSLLADRVRTLPRDKQQMFVTAVNCLFMAIDDTPTLPPAPQVMMGIFNVFSNPIMPPPPPPPPAAASQRYRQAATYRANHVDAYSGHTPVPSATGHRSTTALAQAYFVCPVEGRTKYCSAQAPERSERPGACALQYFALPSTGLTKYACAGAVAEDQKRTSCNIRGLSTALQNALQNAADKPQMPVCLPHP
ncbi:unnamed protein product [Ranitomeya imitator]|uniref:MADF domain-containing protein n=1 Tax=Ranitomeya imitator TaxID=111125 RepID=A0ABN9MHA1_9NEOB|nr:unnamed protein product [Ranitomeya imitator]